MPRTAPYRVWKGITNRYRCKCGGLVQQRIDADTGKNVVLNLPGGRLGEHVDEKLRKFELYPPEALHWLTCAAKNRQATI